MILKIMNLTKLKVIAKNLADHLDLEINYGRFKDTPKKIDVDILKGKSKLSKSALEFFRGRTPKTFDFERIKEIRLKISRTMTSIEITVNVKVDDKEFTSKHASMRV